MRGLLVLLMAVGRAAYVATVPAAVGGRVRIRILAPAPLLLPVVLLLVVLQALQQGGVVGEAA